VRRRAYKKIKGVPQLGKKDALNFRSVRLFNHHHSVIPAPLICQELAWQLEEHTRKKTSQGQNDPSTWDPDRGDSARGPSRCRRCGGEICLICRGESSGGGRGGGGGGAEGGTGGVTSGLSRPRRGGSGSFSGQLDWCGGAVRPSRRR
jgi:hypothetical protein